MCYFSLKLRGSYSPAKCRDWPGGSKMMMMMMSWNLEGGLGLTKLGTGSGNLELRGSVTTTIRSVHQQLLLLGASYQSTILKLSSASTGFRLSTLTWPRDIDDYDTTTTATPRQMVR